MAKVSLHPSVRERNDPRLSANQLAEYAVFGIDRAENIVHDAKFLQAYIPSWYDDSQAALASYLADPLRNKKPLYDEIERLKKVAETSKSGDERDKANLDWKIIDRFLLIENAIGLQPLGCIKPKACAPLMIEKVQVSVQPDLLIHPLMIGKTKKVGAVVFRLSKGIDPESAKTKETQERRKEQRREMGRYVALLVSMALEKYFADHGEISPEHCLSIDIPLGEAIRLSTADRVSRTKRLKKACRQVAQMWPNVSPKPGICL